MRAFANRHRSLLHIGVVVFVLLSVALCGLHLGEAHHDADAVQSPTVAASVAMFWAMVLIVVTALVGMSTTMRWAGRDPPPGPWSRFCSRATSLDVARPAGVLAPIRC